MNWKDKTKKELEELVTYGRELQLYARNYTASKSIVENYEKWYSKALAVIRQILPDRINEFEQLYRDKKKGYHGTRDTYGISHFLHGAMVPAGSLKGDGQQQSAELAQSKFAQQVAILASAEERLDTALADLTFAIRAELFENEIESAKALQKNKFLRAAGAVAGVVLEKHLATVCTNRLIQTKKNPTISDLAAELKSKSAVSLETWKRIDYLGGLRNLCCHNKGKEPSAEEVSDLIAGVEFVCANVF